MTRAPRAFSLVEMVVVISLTTIVGLALFAMIAFFYRTNAHLLEATSAVDSASRGLGESLESLREASYGEDGTYPLASAATSSITFYADLDTDSSVERVRLYLSGMTLYRGVTNAAGNPPSYGGQAEAVETIATFVKNDPSVPLFRYYDEDGTEVASTSGIARIRQVTVRLDVDINPQRAPNILRLEGASTLRNLRSQ